MALKIRVMASNAPLAGRGPQPPLVYHAEAYRDTDLFREPVWGCPHQHRTVQGALQCAQEWMGSQAESA